MALRFMTSSMDPTKNLMIQALEKNSVSKKQTLLIRSTPAFKQRCFFGGVFLLFLFRLVWIQWSIRERVSLCLSGSVNWVTVSGGKLNAQYLSVCLQAVWFFNPANRCFNAFIKMYFGIKSMHIWCTWVSQSAHLAVDKLALKTF